MPPFFRLLGFEPPQAPVALNIEYTILDALVERPTLSLPFFRLTVSFLICATSILT